MQSLVTKAIPPDNLRTHPPTLQTVTTATEPSRDLKGPAVERPVDTTVIIPAYNEELRMTEPLLRTYEYLKARNRTFEIIVVDDGSSDRTAEIVMRLAQDRPEIRLVQVTPNRGKGNAVREGVFHAKGDRIIFVDADGSTPIEEIARLEQAIESGAHMAIGSRAAPSTDTTVKSLWYRKVLGRMFNFCVNLFLVPGIKDTQCGFKMFTAEAAKFLFSRQQCDRFGFDYELLYIAKRAKLTVREEPVNWVNVAGSKVNLVLDSARMLAEIFVFQARHRDVTPRTYQRWLNEYLAQSKGGEGIRLLNAQSA